MNVPRPKLQLATLELRGRAFHDSERHFSRKLTRKKGRKKERKKDELMDSGKREEGIAPFEFNGNPLFSSMQHKRLSLCRFNALVVPILLCLTIRLF
jgi:hypothetical protein